MSQTTRTLRTSELSLGDVVLCHGMEVLLDRAPIEYESHPGRPARSFRGLVLNFDEVPADVKPYVRIGNLDDAPGDGVRWTIQGNDLASWVVSDSGAAR